MHLNPSTLHRRLRATALLAIAATTTGCLFGGNTSVRRTGNDVPSPTFEQIQPGTTTRAWVLATLGEPTSKQKDGPDEVWKYTYTEHVDSNGYVFLIFGSSNQTETTRSAIVQFQDGVVVRKWRG